MESIAWSQTCSPSSKEVFRKIIRVRELSSNELITIYEKHTILTMLNIGWVSYYFKSSTSKELIKLTRKNLLNTYRYTEFEKALIDFLKTHNLMSIDRFTGEFALLQIINIKAYQTAYQFIKYKMMLGIPL